MPGLSSSNQTNISTKSSFADFLPSETSLTLFLSLSLSLSLCLSVCLSLFLLTLSLRCPRMLSRRLLVPVYHGIRRLLAIKAPPFHGSLCFPTRSVLPHPPPPSSNPCIPPSGEHRTYTHIHPPMGVYNCLRNS